MEEQEDLQQPYVSPFDAIRRIAEDGSEYWSVSDKKSGFSPPQAAGLQPWRIGAGAQDERISCIFVEQCV